MFETEGKPISCRAAVAWENGKPLVVETVEVNPPSTGEVRIKMVAAGVCHSDLTYFNGGYVNAVFPCIIGHEGAGIVESIGGRVTSVKPGDHVVVSYITNCGECTYCRNPKTNLCCRMDELETGIMLDGTTRLKCKGRQLYHYYGVSTFGEYSVVPEIGVIKIAESMPLDRACLIGCCVSTGYGATLNTVKVETGSKVAVWGLGGVGLSVVMECKAAGAARIIGIDIKAEKFDIAKDLGCTECLNPNDHTKPIQQILKVMTDGGLDYTFECIGHAETMEAAFESSHLAWGTTVIIGIGTKRDLTLNPWKLLSGRTVKGSKVGGSVAKELFPRLCEEYLAGRLNLDKLITHRMSLDEINKAFDVMRAGESIRSVILFE